MKSKLFALTGLVLLIVVAGTIVVPMIEPHHLARHEMELRSRIHNRLVPAVALGIIAYTLISLVPGTSGKAIVVGWLFGFWAGLTVAMAGLTIAAQIIFVVIRFVFRDAVEAKLGARLKLWEKWLDREGAWFLLTLRMAHVPYSLVNYLSAASRVPQWTFGWTTFVGLLPGTIVFVWMGSRLPTIHELIQHGARELLDPWLWVALVSVAVLPLGIRWLVRAFHRDPSRLEGN